MSDPNHLGHGSTYKSALKHVRHPLFFVQTKTAAAALCHECYTMNSETYLLCSALPGGGELPAIESERRADLQENSMGAKRRRLENISPWLRRRPRAVEPQRAYPRIGKPHHIVEPKQNWLCIGSRHVCLESTSMSPLQSSLTKKTDA